MAVGDPLSSASIIDSTGANCSKSEILLNLGCLDQLIASGSHGRIAKASPPRVSPLPEATHNPVQSVPVSSSWAGVVETGTLSNRQPLDFVSPIYEENSPVLKIPKNIIDAGRKKFSLCLVGQFLGSAPKLGLIHAISNKLWGRNGSVTIAPYKSGMFLFQFPDASVLSRALHGGPWHVSGIPLILRLWDSKIQTLDISSSVLPVWIQLRDVPLELFNVCVEVDFAKALVPSLEVDLNDGKYTIGVSYSWKPLHCTNCGKWGHYHLACPTKQPVITQWVPKIPTASPIAPTTLETSPTPASTTHKPQPPPAPIPTT
ncbi:hypothetical protein Tsubulata_046164 [Turnera subulata]|uniref:CCHC-type domain-containing protein n=1 Tax=Turnera subulata TaxID=218843 RepID=A0A9Q0G8N5_9ROSI|nr:hypothetical protein Tsubulata_046164 [Turnera subulata]